MKKLLEDIVDTYNGRWSYPLAPKDNLIELQFTIEEKDDVTVYSLKLVDPNNKILKQDDYELHDKRSEEADKYCEYKTYYNMCSDLLLAGLDKFVK